MRKRLLAAALASWAGALAWGAWAGDAWPQWRGPGRDGKAPDLRPRGGWPEAPAKVWSVEVGAGLSSPVSDGERVYLMTREGEREVVRSLEADSGETVWRREYAAPFFPNVQASNPRLFPESRGRGPFATPLLAEGRLFTLGADRMLTCWDARSGQRLWQRHFYPKPLPENIVYRCPPCRNHCDERTFDEPGVCPVCGMRLSPRGLDTSATWEGPNYYGAASSPLMAGGRLIVHVGDAEKSELLALDATTGKEEWSWDGPAVSSSSPILAEILGTPQLITLNRTDLTALSPSEGRPLWRCEIPSNAQIVTPVAAGGLVVYAGYRGPLTALRISLRDGRWEAREAWKNPELRLETSTPVVHGGRLYGFFYSERGHFAAVDLETGDAVWEGEGRQGRGAALLVSGSSLLALTDSGELRVVALGEDAYRERTRYTLADTPIWTHPAAISGDLVVKDARRLTRWSFGAR